MGKVLSKPRLAELLRRILSRPPQKPDEWSDDRAAFALHAIGAARTARMLEKALFAPEDEAAHAALDASFFEDPEDLAALAARHAKLG